MQIRHVAGTDRATPGVPARLAAGTPLFPVGALPVIAMDILRPCLVGHRRPAILVEAGGS